MPRNDTYPSPSGLEDTPREEEIPFSGPPVVSLHRPGCADNHNGLCDCGVGYEGTPLVDVPGMVEDGVPFSACPECQLPRDPHYSGSGFWCPHHGRFDGTAPVPGMVEPIHDEPLWLDTALLPIDPDRKLTTYELIDAAAALAQQFMRLPPDDPDSDIAESLRTAILDHLEADVDKQEALYHVQKRMGRERDHIQEELQRLLDRRKRAERGQERVKALALELLQSRRDLTGEKSVSTATFTARLQSSQDRVEVEEGVAGGLPSEYRRKKTTYAPRRDAIREALGAGRDIPGCRLVPSEHVRYE